MKSLHDKPFSILAVTWLVERFKTTGSVEGLFRCRHSSLPETATDEVKEAAMASANPHQACLS